MTPRATYRIQFNKDFGFDSAARLAPYLSRLGVSHLYASPYFKAHPGSTHGYDIVDHDQLNPELGGEAGFGRLNEALAANGLRQILDFVPNHMGVGGADNAIWLDLLEWGPEADHAGWFDIDWTPDRTDLRGKVLVPFLGDQYGVALENGTLVLRFDAEEGSFAVWAHGTHKLPICPTDYATILGQDHAALERLGDAFSDLLRWRPQIMRRARELKGELRWLASPEGGLGPAIEVSAEAFNGRTGDPASWQRLHELIARQNWKPSHFLVAGDDINYRRFFNIATLAGLRMELPDVFDHTHRLVFGLIRDGVLDGLRIDHIDGLFDPKSYLKKLRSDAPASQDGTPSYLVVEKILGREEPLREDWPVDGTTGYEFTNLLTGLLVQPANEGAFTRLYRRFTGETRSFSDIVLSSKLQIIDNEMSSELHRLARAATHVARQNTHTADFTLTVLQRALRQIVAAFPVYRTYVDGIEAPSPEDLRQLGIAIAAAARNEPSLDPSVFGFLAKLLSGELVAKPRSGYQRSSVFRCAMKFQQYCGPVMAKGVEDTAFYRYNRFVALNEVGGSPDRFGVAPEEFHAANRLRAERWPSAMLATSTHDTKRGEDTRARLAALSGLPEEWESHVERWSEMLRPSEGGANGPDRNDEYLFYQLAVGTFPPELMGQHATGGTRLDDYVERLKSVMTKSMREAKVHSTWVAPDGPYEEATLGFVEDALRGRNADRFLASLKPFAERVAALGAHNSFVQTVLKCTAPGMPDFYQGTELWDLSMVDPDNRRPVDYSERETALPEIQARLDADRGGAMRDLLARWPDGRFKLALTRLLLDLRASGPELFSAGGYEPLDLSGPGAGSLFGFRRRNAGTSIVVLGARFPAEPVDHGASMRFPADLHAREGRNILTGAVSVPGADPKVKPLLDGLPASVILFEAPE